MISKLEKSHGNVVGFKFHGKASDEDYKERLIPEMEGAHREARQNSRAVGSGTLRRLDASRCMG